VLLTFRCLLNKLVHRSDESDGHASKSSYSQPVHFYYTQSKTNRPRLTAMAEQKAQVKDRDTMLCIKKWFRI